MTDSNQTTALHGISAEDGAAQPRIVDAANGALSGSSPLLIHSSRSHSFHLLDAMRGIAAVMVVPRHIPPPLNHAIATHNSFLAVDFFFCLSGFVIAFAYEQRLLSGSLSARDFVIARIIRLIPLTTLGTLLGIAIMVSMPSLWSPFPRQAFLPISLLSLFILPNLFWSPDADSAVFPFNVPVWSLFFEFLANFLYLWIVRRIARNLGVIIGVAAVSLLMMLLFIFPSWNFAGGFTTNTFPLGFIRVGLSFFVGILVYRSYRNLRPAHFVGARSLFTSGAVLTTFIFCMASANRITLSRPFAMACIVFFFPAMVYLGALVNLSGHWATLCSVLGDLSFPLYVLHFPLVLFFHGSFGKYILTHPSWFVRELTAPLYVLALASFALLAARTIDIPARRYLTRLYKAYSLKQSVIT